MFSGATSANRWRDLDFVGEQQRDAVVVVKGLQRIAELLFPRRAQGEGEGTVDAVAPEGVQDDLPRLRCAQRVVVVLDQQMVPVRQLGPRRLLLPVQKQRERLRPRPGPWSNARPSARGEVFILQLSRCRFSRKEAILSE